MKTLKKLFFLVSDIQVVSMSGLQAFKRCSKKYQIQYEYFLDGLQKSEAMEEGTTFHELMKQYALTRTMPEIDSSILDVAKAFLKYNKFPENIIAAEKPMYVKIQGVHLRCTFDLLYKDGDTLVIRDWKTFSNSPSYDADLDFQAKTYLVCASELFETTNIRFEHVYVRRTPPYVPKDKKMNEWLPDECYIYPTPIIPSELELIKTRDEINWDLCNLRHSKTENFYTRTNLKGGGYDSCDRCSVKEICKIDASVQEFTNDLAYGISINREPIVILEELS